MTSLLNNLKKNEKNEKFKKLRNYTRQVGKNIIQKKSIIKNRNFKDILDLIPISNKTQEGLSHYESSLSIFKEKSFFENN